LFDIIVDRLQLKKLCIKSLMPEQDSTTHRTPENTGNLLENFYN